MLTLRSSDGAPVPGQLDPERLRADFPILGRPMNGRPLVYLDNAATTQKPRAVIQALVDYYEQTNANVHRGVYELSQRATDAYESARSRVARFIGADDARGVVFTGNATDAINLVARAWGDASLKPGDEIVTTEMEHHSNLVPWQMLAERTGATLRVTPVLPASGRIDVDALAAAIGPRTRLVAVTHCSNVLGTINPIAEIAALAHERGAFVLVDAAQSAPHLPLDVKSLGADAVAFSAHKMCGPTGLGVLWARPDVLDAMPPYRGGGSMIREVWNDRATWADAPQRFEAGTPNIADAIAFAAALEYLDTIGMDEIRAHEVDLTRYALEQLAEIPGLRTYGPGAEERSGVVSFNLYSDPAATGGSLIHPHDVGTVLDAAGIAIRAGHHCCNPLMRRLGVPAAARASFYLYNTRADVDALVAAVASCRELFG